VLVGHDEFFILFKYFRERAERKSRPLNLPQIFYWTEKNLLRLSGMAGYLQIVTESQKLYITFVTKASQPELIIVFEFPFLFGVTFLL